MTLSATSMQQHLTAGRALPLLPDGIPGPVHYAGTWWAIPQDGVNYQQVTASEAEQFTALAQRLGTGARAVQQEQRTQGGDAG